MWRQQADSELDILQSSLANLAHNTLKSSLEVNSQYKETLERIVAPKATIAASASKLKLEPSAAFKESMVTTSLDLGKPLLSELKLVHAYIDKLYSHLNNLHEHQRANSKGTDASDLDAFVKATLDLGSSSKEHSGEDCSEVQSKATYTNQQHLKSEQISALVKAISAPENDKVVEIREITTQANFKASNLESVAQSETLSQSQSAETPKDKLSADDYLAKAQAEAEALLQEDLVTQSINTATLKPKYLPASLTLEKKGCEVIYCEGEITDAQHAHTFTTYFKDDMLTVFEALSRSLDKTEVTHIRHQNNNKDYFSSELKRVLQEVLEQCGERHTATVSKAEALVSQSESTPLSQNETTPETIPEATITLSESFDEVPPDSYESELLYAEDEENLESVVSGADFSLLKIENENSNKLVDGKPTAQSSFEAEIYLGDNRALGRQLQAEDFYQSVEKSDPWLADVVKVGFAHGPVYACLSYTKRIIDAHDPNLWILYMSADFKMMADDQNFVNTLKNKFSLLTNRDIKIEIHLVPDLPPGCPELLAREALQQAVVAAREELKQERAIADLIARLGDNLDTVELSLYTQLAPTVKP